MRGRMRRRKSRKRSGRRRRRRSTKGPIGPKGPETAARAFARGKGRAGGVGTGEGGAVLGLSGSRWETRAIEVPSFRMGRNG
eukprot:6405144-Pyramimonas_sp.AAC.1